MNGKVWRLVTGVYAPAFRQAYLDLDKISRSRWWEIINKPSRVRVIMGGGIQLKRKASVHSEVAEVWDGNSDAPARGSPNEPDRCEYGNTTNTTVQCTKFPQMTHQSIIFRRRMLRVIVVTQLSKIKSDKITTKVAAPRA